MRRAGCATKRILLPVVLAALLAGTAPGASTATATVEPSPGSVGYQGKVGETFAGASVQFDLVTHGRDQYLAFFDVDRDIVVKHRTLGPDGHWTARTIPETSYNPSPRGRDASYRSRWDSHNYLRLGVDRSGNVHLAGDMHNTDLRYWRTSRPGDLRTLHRVRPLVSTRLERRATYPEFINRPNGDLGWLMFRHGVSGHGDTYVYRWHDRGGFWSRSVKLFESSSSYFDDGDGNAYMEVFSTLDGWYHLVYNWREAASRDSNSRLSYIKTRNFRRFENAAGRPVSLPVTADSRRPVVDPVPAARDAGGGWVSNGFVNGDYQFIKVGDLTVLAYNKLGEDSNGDTNPQVWVASRDGEDHPWVRAQLTEEPGGVGVLGDNYPDNYIVVMQGGRLAVDFDYDDAAGRPLRRVTFDPRDLGGGPVAATDAPLYYPSGVYPTPDSFPGVSVNTTADSRSIMQTGGIANRRYINSRPRRRNTLYVVSWLAGANTFTPPDPTPPQAEIDSWPARPLRMYKITY